MRLIVEVATGVFLGGIGLHYFFRLLARRAAERQDYIRNEALLDELSGWYSERNETVTKALVDECICSLAEVDAFDLNAFELWEIKRKQFVEKIEDEARAFQRELRKRQVDAAPISKRSLKRWNKASGTLSYRFKSSIEEPVLLIFTKKHVELVQNRQGGQKSRGTEFRFFM